MREFSSLVIYGYNSIKEVKASKSMFPNIGLLRISNIHFLAVWLQINNCFILSAKDSSSPDTIVSGAF